MHTHTCTHIHTKRQKNQNQRVDKEHFVIVDRNNDNLTSSVDENYGDAKAHEAGGGEGARAGEVETKSELDGWAAMVEPSVGKN